MAPLWVITVAVLAIIGELRCDVINVETTTDNNEITTEQSTTTVENKHIVKLFPKITKKFVVTLSPPIRRPNNITTKRRLMHNVTFRRKINNESPREVRNKITRPPLMKPRKFVVDEHNSNLPTSTIIPMFIKRRERIRYNLKNRGATDMTNTDNNTSNDTNNVFQSDTFLTFDMSNVSKIREDKEEEDSKTRMDFDASIEINTMSSIFLDESSGSEESNESEEVEIKIVKSNLKKETSRQNLSTRKFDLSDGEDEDRNEFLFVGSHIKNVRPAAAVVTEEKPTTKRPRFVMRNPRLQRGIKKYSNPASPYIHSTQKLPKKYYSTEPPVVHSTQELPFRFYFKLKNIIHV